MEFSKPFFLIILLVLALGIYYLVKKVSKNNAKAKNIVLFVFSLLFYLTASINFFFVTIAYLFLIYGLGLLIGKTKKKLLYILFAVLSLSYMIVFKVLEVTTTIALPLAISFIAFQSYSYLNDIYKGKIEPEKNVLNFLTYSLLFTKLIQGPIMTYKTISEQLNSREESSEKFNKGMVRFSFGLFKKVVIASFLYPTVSQVFSLAPEKLSTPVAWIGILAYTLFLYYDFSSYSDMAVGISKMFGIDVIENFNHPYTSFSITDFWRRWHISLSMWFKEYVYIPLGGNRKGKLRTLLNVAIVFILTGIWHGFTLNFLVWGAYFALVMVIEKAFLLKYLDKNKFKPLNVLYCFVVIVIGWVFFASPSVSYAGKFIGVMFGMPTTPTYTIQYYLTAKMWIGFILGFLFIGFIQRSVKKPEKFDLVLSIAGILLLVVSLVLVIGGSYSPSVYGGF